MMVRCIVLQWTVFILFYILGDDDDFCWPLVPSFSLSLSKHQYHQKPPTHVPLSYIIVESPLTFPRWFKKKSFDCGYMWEEKIPPPCHALSSPSSSSSSSPPSSPSSSSSSSPSSPASWFWEAATSLDRKSAKKWRRRNLASKMLRLFPLNLFFPASLISESAS